VAAVEFRGNLDTRLRKVRDGVVQAAILAAAGIERLGIPLEAGSHLDPSWWVPAPGQGALAVEALTDRLDVAALCEPLTDRVATAELAAERAFGTRLEGGCSVPLGCSAVADGDRITVTGYLGSPGGRGLRESLTGNVADAASLGVDLAEAILVSGGDSILVEIEGRAAPVVEEP